MLNRKKRADQTIQHANGSFQSEAVAERQIERFISEIGNAIRATEPSRRADLKDYAGTLLNQEIDTSEFQPFVERSAQARSRQNPLAAGLLLVLLGAGLGLITLAVGATLASIGFLLVIWGAVMSWRRETHA